MMPCNCGKSRPKVAITSAAAEAMMTSPPKYKVTDGNGAAETYDTYIEAKTVAVQTGGTLTEVR